MKVLSMKILSKQNFKILDDSNIFISVNIDKLSQVRFYDLVDLSGQYSGYYIAIKNNAQYEWCIESSSKDSDMSCIVSFEDVLNNVNLELKELLLFHLDIFS